MVISGISMVISVISVVISVILVISVIPVTGICRFPLSLGVWVGLRFVIVALPGRFSYLFLLYFILFALFRYLPRLKVMFRCVSPYFYTRHRAKLRREVTPPMKIIKTLIKSLLFQKILPNLGYIICLYII